jgi:vacuolar-type H+-ATPase subunit H
MSNSAENALSAKRVGQYLIDAGVLKAEQLDEALNRQKRMSKAGFHVLLGTILEEMGAIDRQSLEAVILRQRLDEGSVSLGSEADWTPFRSAPSSEAPPQPSEYTNGHHTPDRQQPAEPEDGSEPVIESSAFEFETIGQEPAPATWPSQPAPLLENEQQPTAPAAEAQTPEPERQQVTPKPDAQELVTQRQSPGSDTTDIDGAREPASSVTEQEVSAPPPVQTTEPTRVPQPASVPSPTDRVPVAPAPTYEAAPTPPAQAFSQPPTVPDPTPMPATVPASTSLPTTAAEVPPRQTVPPSLEVLGFTFARTSDGGLRENEVVAVLAQLTKRSQALEAQLSELSDSVSHLDSMRRYGEQTIKAADTIADQIRTEAEQQAAATRDRAQQEARRIIAEGRSRHDHILRQAAETARRLGSEVIKNIDQHRQLNDHLMEITDAIVNTEPDTSGPFGSE